jgi:hypothetical protein
MSTQYLGGFITKSPVAPTISAASGIWTVDQALQYVKAGTWPSPPPPNYIEDVFSTYVYNGNNSTLTITNNINLSAKGGLVWTKAKNAAGNNVLYDTVRGATNVIISNTTAAQATVATGVTGFTTSGYTIGTSGTVNGTVNDTFVSWTFREQSKFFDIVTYTGNGADRDIAHNLGSVPGMILVKSTSTASGWAVYHRSLTSGNYLVLESTAASVSNSTYFTTTAPTSTTFRVGTANNTNANTQTFVAYLFAHNAGGFDVSDSANVISCGIYAGTGSSPNLITLGYEPQLLLVKSSNAINDWGIFDITRGLSVTSNNDDYILRANTSGAESLVNNFSPTSTGFTPSTGVDYNTSGENYIYMAIRRGPMKIPTVGSAVFGINARTGTGVDATVTGISAGISDAVFIKSRSAVGGTTTANRLTRNDFMLTTATTAASQSTGNFPQQNWDVMDGVQVGTGGTTNVSADTYINYLFRRAPSFFDQVFFTGNGTTQTITHNLGVVPELFIAKSNSNPSAWAVYCASIPSPLDNYLNLNATTAKTTSAGYWGTVAPTSTTFSFAGNVNTSTYELISYLFATLAGISKVGTYTGTAALQTIACGFTTGARFVLIKRTDSAGDWYVYDSTRGLSSSTDPYFLMNTTAAEVTGTDYVDTDTTGFKVTAAASTTVNVSAATYIFLAIA